MLGLRFCARAFSSCGKRGPLFIAVRRPLTVAASLVAEHRLQTRRPSSCGSWVQLLRGMWDLPRPGLEPACPALAGRFSTTAPPGKPSPRLFDHFNISTTFRSPSSCYSLLILQTYNSPPKIWCPELKVNPSDIVGGVKNTSGPLVSKIILVA